MAIQGAMLTLVALVLVCLEVPWNPDYIIKLCCVTAFNIVVCVEIGFLFILYDVL